MKKSQNLWYWLGLFALMSRFTKSRSLGSFSKEPSESLKRSRNFQYEKPDRLVLSIGGEQMVFQGDDIPDVRFTTNVDDVGINWIPPEDPTSSIQKINQRKEQSKPKSFRELQADDDDWLF